MLTAPPVAAAEAIEDLSLEDLLNMKTTVAAREERPLREAPAVLTVVTRDEMLAVGARDLLDVLHLVAGFSLARDVESIVDAGFRSVWGHEGKILLMLDGQETNEPLYGSLQLGNHFLLANVDRIEIVRGPGSALYGGNAELAVINIISRSPGEMRGFSVQADYGQFPRLDAGAYARRTLQLSYGEALTPDLEVSAAVVGGQGHFSDGVVRDFAGDAFVGLGPNGRSDPWGANLALRYGAMRLRFIYDRYNVTDRYPYDSITDHAIPLSFETLLADAQVEVPVSEGITLLPRVGTRRQRPWCAIEPTLTNFDNDYYDKSVWRTYAALTAQAALAEKVSLQVGAQATFDHASVDLGDGSLNYGANQPFDPSGRTTVTYQNLAAFAQLGWDSPLANVTAGARFERHSRYGASFVPRLGLTKVIDGWHFKALASSAFRAPTIENMRITPSLSPERTLGFEIETGYILTENVFVALNAYDLTIRDPIIYSVGPDGSDLYSSRPRAGARGVELDLRLKGGWGFVTGTYSYANSAGKNEVPEYEVPGASDRVLGLP
ncbi:MAG TPA: TonB-dependent receptor plug domain-containing protein, partial [Myxococcota bacterium]|nr:TonB-dependent receptor plug domain-containing protein [Myxococcota bacterium]